MSGREHDIGMNRDEEGADLEEQGEAAAGPAENAPPENAAALPPEDADPYEELERYLAQVHEEIGQVFELWYRNENEKSSQEKSEPEKKKPPSESDEESASSDSEAEEKSARDAVENKAADESAELPPAAPSEPAAEKPPCGSEEPPCGSEEPNHLAEFERVVADEIVTLTPSPSESSEASCSSWHDTKERGGASGPGRTSDKATATSPSLKPKEVVSFLKKVENTILGQDARAIKVCVIEAAVDVHRCDVPDSADASLDAATQTQDLSRSSSTVWLSNSSLIDSPVSAPSHASGESVREDSTEDTSSSSEALLASESTIKTVRYKKESNGWTNGDVSGSKQTLASENAWYDGSHSAWTSQSHASFSPESEQGIDICSPSRDGIASDNEMTSHRTRKHHHAGMRIAENATSQQDLQSLNSLRGTAAPAGTPLAPELSAKSSSAPLLAKNKSCLNQNTDAIEKSRNHIQVRSHSDRQLSEIEAIEACRWMRAAGFPQYAQMYEDLQFPVDMNSVQKDHPFLDQDAMQALFRRLSVLNKCAKLRLDAGSLVKNPIDDSDEEDECALSENWTFLQQSRRWSRVPLKEFCPQQEIIEETAAAAVGGSEEVFEIVEIAHKPKVAADEGTDEEQPLNMQDQKKYGSLPPAKYRINLTTESEFAESPTFRRTGSEKLRDGAKALLRRVESLKTRGKKLKSPKSDENPLISKPQVIDTIAMDARMKKMHCVDLCRVDKDRKPLAKDVSNNNLDCKPQIVTLTLQDFSDVTEIQQIPIKRRPSKDTDDIGTLSDTECLQWSNDWFEDDEKCEINFKNNNSLRVNSEPRKKSFRKRSQQLHPAPQKAATLALDVPKQQKLKPPTKLVKSDDGGLADLSPDAEDEKVVTERSRKKSFGRIRKSSEARGNSDTASQDDEPLSPGAIQKASVLRWHSFRRESEIQKRSCKVEQLSSPVASPHAFANTAIDDLSCGQLMVLKKLATLKLTATVEKYCPALRSTGFNWEFPKIIKKTKSPSSKDPYSFKTSLLLSLQTTGQALPPAIQAAVQHLVDNALDQVGLFRKPGVKSRIQKLKAQMIETGLSIPLNLTLEEQQCYDVADLVKQFFRELPEALLTAKLSGTFLSIFLHVPESNRLEAVRSAVFLLPDQHREVLHYLLRFLLKVAAHSKTNQMTESNLAVCLAPSLFTQSTSCTLSPGDTDTQRSSSPRNRGKKKNKSMVGAPDAKELAESKAAQDCVLFLLNNLDDIICVSGEMMAQCKFSLLDQSKPLPLCELGADMGQDWRGYMRACTMALLKECRERTRSWVTITSPDPGVDLAYKKVNDGHPLRIWRVSTEVEAPPAELLQRILREQEVWDPSLIKWRVLSKLDNFAEVFNYACRSMAPLPPRAYCVLRTWSNELPRGACYMVETSIDYPGSNDLVAGSVQAVVLASRYLIEPCGSGRCRVLHLSRVDMKGRRAEWYNKCYGHACALNLKRMRASFAHTTGGPESNV